MIQRKRGKKEKSKRRNLFHRGKERDIPEGRLIGEKKNDLFPKKPG